MSPGLRGDRRRHYGHAGQIYTPHQRSYLPPIAQVRFHGGLRNPTLDKVPQVTGTSTRLSTAAERYAVRFIAESHRSTIIMGENWDLYCYLLCHRKQNISEKKTELPELRTDIPGGHLSHTPKYRAGVGRLARAHVETNGQGYRDREDGS